jgi:hypothetical protein
VLNVAHAEPTFAARGVAAIPPAALVLGVELLMMVIRRATGMRAARLEHEHAEERQERELAPARMTLGAFIRRGASERSAPQVEDGERAGEVGPWREPGAVVVSQRVRTQPPLVAEPGSAYGPTPPARRPSLPRRNSMAPADYILARRMARYIVEEREPGEVRTAEELLTAALGAKGITIDPRTAKHLLREFDVPKAETAREERADDSR